MKVPALFLMAFLVSVSAIASSNGLKKSSMDALSGTWAGTLTSTVTTELVNVDTKLPQNYEIIYQHCGKKPKIFLREKSAASESFESIYLEAQAVEKSGTFILYSIGQSSKKDPSWVESQVWSFVKIDESNASVFWSRSVSNPTRSSDDRLRSFGQFGPGSMKKISDSCI